MPQDQDEPAGSLGQWEATSLPAGSGDWPPVDAPLRGGHTDRYDLGAELGRGAMGRVRAAQDRRLGREVAIKELRPGRDPRRMAREARITALLEHPGIVPVYDAGELDDGRPFYAMRLVRGRPLSAVLAQTPATEDRLALLRRVLDATEAVAFAHSLGVVHRDLKPANIILGDFGETQVVDWGLARAEGQPELARHLDEGAGGDITQAGAVLGTPAYMSPEQAAGEAGDRRSDVWSLGALLFELVQGRPPYSGDTNAQILHQVRTLAPPTLRDPPELGAIVGRALARDPDDRYPDAAALALDLSRFIDGRRVAAYAYSPWELAARLVRAWRVPLALGALALAAVGATALTGWSNTSAERDRAVDAEAAARRALGRADRQLQRALVAQAEVAMERGHHAEAEVLAVHALGVAESPAARGVLAALGLRPRPSREVGRPQPACITSAVDRAGALLLCADDRSVSLWEDGRRRWSLGQRASAVDLSADGRTVLVGHDGQVSQLSAADGSQLQTWRPEGYRGWGLAQGDDPGHALTWSTTVPPRALAPGGTARTLAGCAGEQAAVSWWGTATLVLCRDGRLLRDGATLLDDPRVGRVSAVAGPAGDGALWFGTLGGELVAVDPATGRVRLSRPLDAGLVTAVTARDGLVAVAVDQGDVLIIHAETGVELARLPGVQARHIRFTGPRTLRVLGAHTEDWSLPAQLAPVRLDSAGGITQVDLDPAGGRLLTAHGSGQVRLWRLADGAILSEETWPEGGVVKSTAFDAGGRRVAATMVNHDAVRVIDLDTHSVSEWPGIPARRLGFLADGTLLTLSYGQTLDRYDRDGGLRQTPVGQSWDLGMTHDHRLAVLAGEQGVALVDAAGVHHLTDDVPVAVDVARGGALVVAAERRSVQFLDGEGRPLRSIPISGAVWDVALSPSGDRLAVGLGSGHTHVYDTADGRLLAVLPGHEGRVSAVEFSDDGQVLVTGAWDGRARLHSLAVLDAELGALEALVADAWGLSLEDVLPGPAEASPGAGPPAGPRPD